MISESPKFSVRVLQQKKNGGGDEIGMRRKGKSFAIKSQKENEQIPSRTVYQNFTIRADSKLNEVPLKDLLNLSQVIEEMGEKINVGTNLPWPTSMDTTIQEKFHSLLNLYIQEEILKHHCCKKGWRFSERITETIIKPAFDLLSVKKERVHLMFEPFLKEISSLYLIYTSIDEYSRLKPSALAISLTQVWIKIKEAELSLKRSLKIHSSSFQDYFFDSGLKCLNGKNSNAHRVGKTKMNKKKFYSYFFKEHPSKNNNHNSQNKMVDLIKIYIFCQKSFGEDFEIPVEQWLNEF